MKLSEMVAGNTQKPIKLSEMIAKTMFDPETSDPSLQYRAKNPIIPSLPEVYSPEGGAIGSIGGGEKLWQKGDAPKIAMQAAQVPYNLGFRGGPETDFVVPNVEPPSFTPADMHKFQQSMKPVSPLGKVGGFVAEEAAKLPFYALSEAALGAPLAAKLAPKLGAKAAPYASSFMRGFGMGAPVETALARGEGESMLQALKQGAATGAMFGGANVAFRGAGELLKGMLKPKAAPAIELPKPQMQPQGNLPEQVRGVMAKRQTPKAADIVEGVNPLDGTLQKMEMPKVELPKPQAAGTPTFSQWAKKEYGDYSDFSKGMMETAKIKYDKHIAELAEIAKHEIKDIPSEFKKMYYRGEKTGETKRISTGIEGWDDNLFVANNPKSALAYGDNIERVALKKNSKVLVEGSKEYKQLVGNKKYKKPSDEYVAVLGKAKEQGYDVVEFSRQTDIGTVVLNENSVVRNYLPATSPKPSLPKLGLTREGSISAAKFTVPEKMADVGDGTKIRSLGVSVMNNPKTPSDVKAGLLMETYEGGAGTYKAITNKETIAQAQRMIADDAGGALRFTKDNPGTALSNTIELEMVKKANLENRFDDAVDIINEVSKRSTTQGQAIQSLRLWGKMTPEGVQKFYARTINSINNDLEKRAGKAAKKLDLNPDIMADIKAGMEKVAKMTEGRGRDIEIAKVLDRIAAEVPVPFLRKIASIQTMAQLLNPKTAIRNIAGNFGFAGMENVSDVVGAVADKGVSLLTGKRTKVLPSLKVQAKGMKQGWKEGVEEALLGIDLKGLATKQDLPKGRVFRSGLLGKLEKGLAIELRATDRAMYQAAYDGSINNQLRAAKVSAPTQEMKDIAHLDGLYRTFQDDNALSKGFQSIKRVLNGQKEFGIGDFVIKYPRTPANLLMRGIEYSPAGFIKTIIKAAEPLAKQQFNQREFVESFSRALVGSTALVGTGALLNKLGIITGKPVADRDLAELQRQQGFGEYRINASALKRLVFGGDVKPQQDDKIIDYSWFQPQALPLAIGADINANKGEPTGIIGTIMQAFGTGVNALADQPVAQGIQTLLSGGYGDATQGFEKVLEGVPSSFVPTLLNQVKQLADNQRRETYDPNQKQKALNLAKNKIPGLAQTLPLKYGTLGQKLETYQNSGNNPFNVFLNPAFINKFNPSKEVQKVNSIYEQTGETNQVPRVADKSITVSGQKFTLTGQEYSEYQRLLGEYTQQAFAKLKADATAKQMQDAMTDANTKAKTGILQARGVRVVKKGNGLTIK